MLGSRALYHDGWKAVTFKPLGAACTTTGSTGARRSTTTCGSCTTSPRTCPRPTTSPRAEPERLAEMVELWWEEARRNTCCRSTTAPPHDPAPASASAARPRPCTCTTRSARPCPEHVAVDVRNRSHTDHRSTSTVPEGGPRGCRRRAARARLRARRLVAAPARRAAALRAQPLRQGVARRSRRTDLPDRRAATSSPTSSSGPRRTRAGATLRCRRRVVGAGEIPRFTPIAFSYTGGGLTCGYEMGPAGGRRLPGAVPVRRRDPPGRPSRCRADRPATRWPSSRRSCRPSSPGSAGRGVQRSSRSPSGRCRPVRRASTISASSSLLARRPDDLPHGGSSGPVRAAEPSPATGGHRSKQSAMPTGATTSAADPPQRGDEQVDQDRPRRRLGAHDLAGHLAEAGRDRMPRRHGVTGSAPWPDASSG